MEEPRGDPRHPASHQGGEGGLRAEYSSQAGSILQGWAVTPWRRFRAGWGACPKPEDGGRRATDSRTLNRQRPLPREGGACLPGLGARSQPSQFQLPHAGWEWGPIQYLWGLWQRGVVRASQDRASFRVPLPSSATPGQQRVLTAGSVTKFGSVLLGTPVAVPALGWSLARPGAMKGGENPQLPIEAPDGRPRGAEEGFWA